VIIEKDTGEPNIEAQANQFASYLLMPANHVRPSIEKSPITLDLISELARSSTGCPSRRCAFASSKSPESVPSWSIGITG
jgi:Zn-dependent peptidase ImmA (M78 family)